MKIFIQNMVSLRCKLMVKSKFDKLKLGYKTIELGEVELQKPISKANRQKLQIELQESGLELMDDKQAILIEKICNIIVEKIHYTEEFQSMNFSTFLAEKMHQDYHKLAEIFSKTKGVTIEHFMILHKVERIKELIMYDELNISEISYKMHYSSVAHMSKQFKQITGLTPSFFKSLPKKKRSNLEDL